jgi:opacity protein-like surface antigen
MPIVALPTKGFLSAMVACAALTATAAMADPVYTLTIEDSAGSYTTTDAGTGQISYTGTLGGFTVNDLTVTNINPVNPYDIAFGSQDIFKASGSDTLNVFVTVSNLTAPAPSSLWIGTTSSANFENGAIQGWATSTSYTDGALSGLLSSSSGGLTANSFTSSTAGATSLSTSPFSYTVEFSLNLLTDQFANGAGASTDVLIPEPASAALLAAGLLGLAVVRRRWA